MTKKSKTRVPRSPGALAAHLRGGAGTHDPRPRRQRTRAASLRAALRD